MGSPCRLVFFEENETKAGELLSQCMSELTRLEAKYSRYREDSLLTQINHQGLQGIVVDAETKGLLDYAHTAFIESNGLFDITSGLFRAIWNFKEQKIPTPLEIEKIRQKVGWQHVTWNSSQLQFQKEGMEIDLGGIVKEYAADRLYDLLHQQGIRHGLIDLGGDIRVIGPHPDGRPWNVGISDPLEPTSARMTLQLTTGAITTSGQYQRGFIYKNRRYGHLIHPKTGWPVTGLLSATVIAPRCLVAGSLTSIAILKGYPKGHRWLDSMDIPYVLITDQNKLYQNLAPTDKNDQSAQTLHKKSKTLTQAAPCS